MVNGKIHLLKLGYFYDYIEQLELDFCYPSVPIIPRIEPEFKVYHHG